MKLRLRLIVAFFLLSIVPLGAVTFYSYTSSARVLSEAAEHEADLLTSELGRRMQLVTAQLGQRVEHLMDLAALEQAVAASPEAPPDLGIDRQIADSLGEAAMLLHNVEFRGRGRRGGRPPNATGDPAGRSRGSDPERRRDPERANRPPLPSIRAVESGQEPQAVIAASGDPSDPIRIDLGAVRREMIREFVPEGQGGELTAEERQRMFLEVNQRMTGIREGLELSAQALEERAEAAARVAEEAASVPVPPAAPPVAAAALTRSTALTGNRLDVSLESDGEVVQGVTAEINLPNLLATVFSTTHREEGEVPFAIGNGEVYTQVEEDRAVVESLGLNAREAAGSQRRANWIVVSMDDPSGSGLRLGIARPIGDSLADLRRTSARNAGLGILFIGLALAVIVPLSSRLTRNLSILSDGVRRIAAGDYRTRVSVKASDEVGELADAFNQMAADVEEHQRTAVERERITRELELGAREVGGDFFNYFKLDDGQVALLVGDVSGKGVGAALLMANIQASLRTRLSLGQDLAAIADHIDREIEAGSPGPVYATLFMAILDPAGRRLRYVNAGHHPQFVLRVGGGLEPMTGTGMPVGLFAGRGYTERQVQLGSGDVLFFYTDGCVEAENTSGDMFGAARLEEALTTAATADSGDALVRVERAVADFRGDQELFDDATMMVVKVG
jgi:HAMP domain-containing protein